MSGKLMSLNVLRGLAALLVVFYHMEVMKPSIITKTFSWGWIGVDVFFVLSGFFIGLSILKSASWSIASFLKRRFLRIAPAYYVSILLIVGLSSSYFLINTNGICHIIVHLFFTHSFRPEFHGSINGAYWTLGIEFFFYILMALSYRIIKNDNLIYYYLAAWVIISWVWRVIFFYYGNPQQIIMFISTTQLPGMLDEFACGILVAKLYISRKSFFHNYLIGIIALITGLFFTFAFIYHIKVMGGNYWSDALSVIFSRSFLSVGIALIIISFIILERSKIFIKICRYSGFYFLGTISYSIYLYHLPVFLNMKNSLEMNNVFTYWSECISIITILLISTVSYCFVEKRYYR
ncbi:hypothetical protein BBB57_23175 [Kosakonia sacchari]|uniref:acyltransferase family protein n=1 Tax=Kosakonia sacchari TaxID=1158459 RepID=UPI000807463F|nr:acyltransferase [Kosakonia sacchari]ANR80894.1 hypothetical protein BBB57_23175 [Kosakonia sacchari]